MNMQDLMAIDPFARNEIGLVPHDQFIQAMVEAADQIAAAGENFIVACQKQAELTPEHTEALLETAADFHKSAIAMMVLIRDCLKTTQWESLSRAAYWESIFSLWQELATFEANKPDMVLQ